MYFLFFGGAGVLRQRLPDAVDDKVLLRHAVLFQIRLELFEQFYRHLHTDWSCYFLLHRLPFLHFIKFGNERSYVPAQCLAGFRLSLPHLVMQLHGDLRAEVARFFCHGSSSDLFNGNVKIPESKCESYYQDQLKIPFQIKRNDHSYPLHEVFHAGDGDAVAEGFVACGVRRAGNIGPTVRVALEPFTFQRGEAANEIPAVRIPGRGRLADKVRSVLMLPSALRGGDLIIPELIHSLAGIDAMAVCGGQGIGNIPLPAEAVAAVLRLPVDGIACNADDFFLLYKGNIVAAGPIAGGHGGCYIVRPRVSSVNAVVFVNLGSCRTQDQRLVSMLLRPQCPSDIFAALHDLPTLIIDTEDAGHTVPAGAALQGGRYALLIPDGPGTRASSSRKTGYKGLLLYPRLSLQRTCYIMQVTHLVPLVGGECDLLLRTTLTAAGICDKGLHLEVLRCHQGTGHTVQVNSFAALVDMISFHFAGYGRRRVKPCLHTQSYFQ